ncbi:MAG: tRNA pseudouridine(38-40) synthase TruA [candidate division WOR-3 bacterium]
MVIKGVVEYDGTDFFGWQVQKDKRTVQGTLIEVLKRILNSDNFKLVGASRTDAGVHAENQVFSLHLKEPVRMSLESLKKALNSLLPNDVYVKSLEEAQEDFHARFKARSKIYKYRILDGAKSPLRTRYVWELPFRLDLGVLRQCADLLKGERDFSFLKLTTGEKKNQKVRFFSVSWDRVNDETVFVVEGDRFLYKLVRVLVASMVYSCKNFKSTSFFESFLEGKEEKVLVAPAKGLTLVSVNY